MAKRGKWKVQKTAKTKRAPKTKASQKSEKPPIDKIKRGVWRGITVIAIGLVVIPLSFYNIFLLMSNVELLQYIPLVVLPATLAAVIFTQAQAKKGNKSDYLHDIGTDFVKSTIGIMTALPLWWVVSWLSKLSLAFADSSLQLVYAISMLLIIGFWMWWIMNSWMLFVVGMWYYYRKAKSA